VEPNIAPEGLEGAQAHAPRCFVDLQYAPPRSIYRTYSTAPRCFSSRSRSANALILFNLKRSLHTGYRLQPLQGRDLGSVSYITVTVLVEVSLSKSHDCSSLARKQHIAPHSVSAEMSRSEPSETPHLSDRTDHSSNSWVGVACSQVSQTTYRQRSVTPDRGSDAGSISDHSLPGVVSLAVLSNRASRALTSAGRICRTSAISRPQSRPLATTARMGTAVIQQRACVS